MPKCELLIKNNSTESLIMDLYQNSKFFFIICFVWIVFFLFYFFFLIHVKDFKMNHKEIRIFFLSHDQMIMCCCDLGDLLFFICSQIISFFVSYIQIFLILIIIFLIGLFIYVCFCVVFCFILSWWWEKSWET